MTVTETGGIVIPTPNYGNAAIGDNFWYHYENFGVCNTVYLVLHYKSPVYSHALYIRMIQINVYKWRANQLLLNESSAFSS